MTRTQTAARILALCAAPILLSALTGCIHGDRSHRRIQRNLTPELSTLYQRPVDVDNAITITFDENGRAFNQDLGRFWLLDRPSRLSPEPNPR